MCVCVYEVTRGEWFIGGKTPKENTQLAEKEEMTAYLGGISVSYSRGLGPSYSPHGEGKLLG